MQCATHSELTIDTGNAGAIMQTILWSSWIQAIAARTFVFTMIWWILTEGEAMFSAWTLVGTGLSVAITVLLWPPGSWTLRFWPLIRFVPFFMWHSLLGGMDVAYRALCPAAHVRPQTIAFSFTLQKEIARVFFIWAVSLLPGTAAIGLDKDVATIHILDVGLSDMDKLHELERHIADIFEH
jgi:multicomponent Na+:H+ antiporter subunit E